MCWQELIILPRTVPFEPDKQKRQWNIDCQQHNKDNSRKQIVISTTKQQSLIGHVIMFLNLFTGYPLVKFKCGMEEEIKPTRWSFKFSGGNTASRKQIPLKLAWAISIHKSQVGI